MEWFFIKYPAGGGGKICMYCLSTSEKVIQLFDKPDPVDFVHKHFPNISNQLPIEKEGYPYNISWFVRQYPFTRGLDLSTDQVDSIVSQDPVLSDADNKIALIHYCRVENPQWFKGKTFTIAATSQSKDWLYKRRKQLFYTVENNKLIDRRYQPKNVLQEKYKQQKFTDTIKYEFDIAETKNVLDSSFEKERCMDYDTDCITIDQLLDSSQHSQVMDIMEQKLDSAIDRVWTKLALKTWANIWK